MKMLALIPASQSKSPVRYYRGEGVLERMPGVEVSYLTEPMNWVSWLRAAKEYEVLYVMRSAQPEHVEWCRDAVTAGMKIWYDLDDDFTAVQPDNPACVVYGERDVQAAFGWFLRNADAITVSTQQLKDKFEPKLGGRKITVIPNALDDVSFPLAPVDGMQKLFTWRGGGSHLLDLQAFTPEIISFLRNQEDYAIQFMGFYPFWMTKETGIRPEQLKYSKYILSYWGFMQYFRAMNPWGHFVPLLDNDFNRAKSCISALEAVWAGAVPVVPDFPEWEIDGALRYTSPEAMRKCMHLFATMSDRDRRDRWNLAAEWIRKNRMLSEITGRRMEILKELMD